MFKKMSDSFISIKNFAFRTRDEDEDRPKIGTFSIIFIITFIVFLILPLWIELWLPYVDRESARWTLSAQVQVTAAIFGLLIVAMAFRWRMVTNQEHQLRNNINSYLETIGTAKSGNIMPSFLVIELAYEKYRDWINAVK